MGEGIRRVYMPHHRHSESGHIASPGDPHADAISCKILFAKSGQLDSSCESSCSIVVAVPV